MQCTKCEYFKVVQNPLKGEKGLMDTGMARCTKHDLVVDFVSTQHINRLTCVEDKE